MKFTFDGDSNPAGNYVSGPSNMVSLIASGAGLTAVNLAVSGRKAQGVLDHLGDVETEAPDIAMCMIGTNDGACAFEEEIPAETWGNDYIDVMEDIIAGYKSLLIPQIFIASPPPARVPRLCDEWPDIVSGLKALCLVENVFYVPVYEMLAAEGINRLGLSSQARWMLADPDKYHGDTAWHAAVADAFIASYQAANPPAYEIVFDESLSSAFGNTSGGTWRTVIPAAALSNVPGSPRTKIRITLKGHADEPLTVGKCYVGHRSSGANASSLTQLLDGASASFTVPQNGSKAVEANFAYDGSSDLIVSGYTSGGGGADRLAAESSFSGAITYYAGGDYAADASVTGFSSYSGYLSGVTMIEIEGS